MMTDMFSSFDPMSLKSSTPSLLMMNLLLCVFIQLHFWPTPHRMNSLLSFTKSIIMNPLTKSFSYHLKGLNNLISALFIMIIITNMMSLAPYQFSLSSHLFFTSSMALPLWVAMTLSDILKSPKKFIARLSLNNSPNWLNPMLVLIETSSMTLRPLTLSFRLAANMTTGHIILQLLNSYMATTLFSSLLMSTTLLTAIISYSLFELMICFIQAFVFCLLLSLYADEHTH